MVVATWSMTKADPVVMRTGRAVAGHRIEALREALGWTPAELARRLQVGRQLVGYWESRESVNIDTERATGLSRLFRVQPIDLTDAGRPIETVVREVRGSSGGAEPLGTGVVRLFELAPVKRIAVHTSRGLRESLGSEVAVLPAYLQAAKAPVALEVLTPMLIEGKLYPEESVVLLDQEGGWQEGRLHLFRYDLRLVLSRVQLVEGDVSWTGEDGQPHQQPRTSLELLGVAYRVVSASEELL